MELKIIRIELLGGASGETYEALHAFMESNGWSRNIFANLPNQTVVGPKSLPTATYCGDSVQHCADIADALLAGLSAAVWANPRVLVMGVGTNWAMRGN